MATNEGVKTSQAVLLTSEQVAMLHGIVREKIGEITKAGYGYYIRPELTQLRNVLKTELKARGEWED